MIDSCMVGWVFCVGVGHYLNGKHEIEVLLWSSETARALHLNCMKLRLHTTAKSAVKLMFS